MDPTLPDRLRATSDPLNWEAANAISELQKQIDKAGQMVAKQIDALNTQIAGLQKQIGEPPAL